MSYFIFVQNFSTFCAEKQSFILILIFCKVLTYYLIFSPPFFAVSGSSGSGKTFASMLLLKQIFSMNGGLESDTFKQLSAAFTVLRSLGSAQTASNRESSRIGHFIEAQVSSGELYRTKIHCYFLDQVRTLKVSSTN